MFLTSTLSPKVILSLCCSMLILFALTAFYTGWQWVEDWQLTHRINAIPENIVTHDDNIALITALPGAHLFGQTLVKDGKVPTSNLQLHVTGIVKVHSETASSVSKAYISIAGQPSKIYQIGDDLAYGVKIYDITKDLVILQNDGHLEKLPLPREPLAFKAIVQEEKA